MNLQTLHQECMQRQNELKALLSDTSRFEEAMQLFLIQHAALHSAQAAPGLTSSLQDAVLEGLDLEQYRPVPAGEIHSLAWLLWHDARCEDITMNLLVADSPQVLDTWVRWLGTPVRDTGNAMGPAEIDTFSQEVDINALLGYHSAVACRTQNIARSLKPIDLKRKTPPERLQRIWDQGAILEPARSIFDYWANRTVTGLLLMPATRHHLVHLNEALSLKHKLIAGARQPI